MKQSDTDKSVCPIHRILAVNLVSVSVQTIAFFGF